MRLPNLPQPPRWLRAAALVLGAAALFWLPIEDVSLAGVLALAVAVSAWWGMRLLLALEIPRERLMRHYLLVGAACGLATAPLAALLMVFKSGLHAHGLPDFSTDPIGLVFKLIPVWVFSGVFLSLGAALVHLSRRPG